MSLPTRQQFDAYQEAAGTTALYPGRDERPFNLFYPALGLTGESGEVADEVKKMWRSGGELTDERQAKIEDEMGDVLWYLAELATSLNKRLEEIAEKNLAKLAKRAKKNELKVHV